MATQQICSLQNLIPYLTWRAPFGKTGILALISQIIAEYCPNNISIPIQPTRTLFSDQYCRDVIKINGFIDPFTHEITLTLSGVQKSEIITIRNYQVTSKCTDDDIWINKIRVNGGHNQHSVINEINIISTSSSVVATKNKITHITSLDDQCLLNEIHNAYSANPIIDMWIQLNHYNTHFVLKRCSNSSYVDILQVNSRGNLQRDNRVTNRLYRFKMCENLIVDLNCCYVLNDMSVCVMYHKYDGLTDSYKLGLRYCCNDTVCDIEIPFHLLNNTYSDTLSADKVYIINIAQKYFFYHKESDHYLLFMQLTYRFKDSLRNKNGGRISMQFVSSMFVWQFQMDWTHRKIKNIAIAAAKIGNYFLVCFDEENGAVLLQERDTVAKKSLNFMIRRLSDIIQKWNYYRS